MERRGKREAEHHAIGQSAAELMGVRLQWNGIEWFSSALPGTQGWDGWKCNECKRSDDWIRPERENRLG